MTQLSADCRRPRRARPGDRRAVGRARHATRQHRQGRAASCTCRYGPEVVASIRGASGVRIFLDLKLHDIPATVASAARAVARLRPELLTVHAAGGPEVVRAAVEARPGTHHRRASPC